MTTEATPGNVPLSDQLGPDGKLHADGYFTWHRRDGYVLDAKLPAEFVLADKVARLAEQVENLRAALQWYADGLHFDKASPDAWDTVSGEPQNWWCDEAGTATVEDGSIAAMVLRGELTGAQVQALE